MIDELIRDFGIARKGFAEKYNVKLSLFDVVLRKYVDDIHNGDDKYLSYPIYNEEYWIEFCEYFEENRTERGNEAWM